jgi:hypothetical protein
MSIISREIYHQKLNEYSKLFSVVTIKDVNKSKKETSEGMPIKIVRRQYEIGGVKKNGIIRFYNHSKDFSLEFTFIEIKKGGTPEKYSQKLFLPLTYSLIDILQIVIKEIYNTETNILKLIDSSSISSDITRLNNLKDIKLNIEKLKDQLYSESLSKKSKLLELENTELKKQRGIYSSLDKSNMRDSANMYLSHRKEKVMPIQKSIFESKKKHQDIYTIELPILLELIESKELLLQLLRIDLNIDDVINRPRIFKTEPSIYYPKNTITDETKNMELYTLGETLVIGISNLKAGSHKNDESSDFTQYVFSNPNWRKLLSVTDKTTPIHIDDFTFNSVLHYHIASQFYNRIDLDDKNREKYNRFFITFTEEYQGDDKLYSASIEDILDIIKREKYKQYYLWNTKSENYCNRDGNLCKGRSISQNYKIKAYLHKLLKQKDLQQLLLATNHSKLIEKKRKNIYEVNYELMEARFIIENNEIDEYLSFNYDPKVKELLQKQEKDETHEFFYNLAEFNLFEKSNSNIDDDPIETTITQLLEIMPNLNVPKVKQTLKDIVFSYLGNHIYQLCRENNITYSSEFIKKYPHLSSNILMIDFITEYIKELNDLSVPLVPSSSVSTIKQQDIIIEEPDQEIEMIKKILKSYKRRIVQVPNNLLINAVIDQLIRQNKYPFNFSNIDDFRTKYPSNYDIQNGKKFFKDSYKLIKNHISRIILNNSQSLYPESEKTIRSYLEDNSGKIFEQIIADMGSDLIHKYWEDKIELYCLSRLFGVDITINNKTKILFNESIIIFPSLPEGIFNYSNTVGNLHIYNHENNFYSTQLNTNQIIKDNQFLIHKDSGTIIHEEIDGTFNYYGILNMNDFIIDTKADMIDLSTQTDDEQEIELGILELYRIDTEGRPILFYGETEILYI